MLYIHNIQVKSRQPEGLNKGDVSIKRAKCSYKFKIHKKIYIILISLQYTN